MRTKLSLLLLSLLLMALAACAPLADPAAPASEPADTPTVVLASHDSFAVSEEVIAAFEEATGAKVQFLTLGDAGEALNKMILSKDAPLADVFFGVDNTFLSRALNAEIFEPYAAPALDEIPADLQMDPEQRLLPVDFGFVNLNADAAWFEAQGLALPAALADLADPAYAGTLVVPNPATSSPGLAFLLTTIAHFGEEGAFDFWAALAANDLMVTDGWSDAYFEHFTVGSGGAGDRPLVVSYSTSPPADVLYASDGRTEPASVNLNLPDGTFRQIEFVGIVAGTAHRDLAEELVDFLLSAPFQEDMPLQMFVYPALPAAELPELFVEFAETPADPVTLSPEEIEANREQWIERWTNTVLR